MEIKSEQGLFMKNEWLGMLVCGINGDKSCVGISVEFHSGDTWTTAYGSWESDAVSG